MNDRDPRRCHNCGAFDAWTGQQRREDRFGLIIIAHECGVCRQWWRIPIRRAVIADVDVREDRL